jgi:Cu/Ag efflux pump CusA
VGGVIVARYGVNTQEVIDAVKARIAQIPPDFRAASPSSRSMTAPN